MKLWEQQLIESNYYSTFPDRITESQILLEGKLELLVSTLKRLEKAKIWIIDQLTKVSKKLKVLERLKNVQTRTAVERAKIAQDFDQVNKERKRLLGLKTENSEHIEKIIEAIRKIKDDLMAIIKNVKAPRSVKKPAGDIGKLSMVNPNLNK